MAVVGRDDNQGLVQDAHLLQLGNGGADGVVQLEQVAEGAVVVERVHLLVDRGGLRHEEEALLAAALVQDVDGLERHLLLAGQVRGRALAARGVVLERGQVVGVDVAVKPHRKVTPAENAQRLLVIRGRQQGRLVPADRVALLGELGVVVLAVQRPGAGDELLGATAEVGVGAVGLGPRVVADAVERLVNQDAVLATAAGVAAERDRGSVGDESSRDGTPGGTLAIDVSKQRTSRGSRKILLTQTRTRSSTMVSTLGSSCGSGDEST